VAIDTNAFFAMVKLRFCILQWNNGKFQEACADDATEKNLPNITFLLVRRRKGTVSCILDWV